MISLSKCPTKSLIKYSNTLGGGISAFLRYNANKTCDSYSSSSRSYSKSSTASSEYNKLNFLEFLEFFARVAMMRFYRSE